MRQIIIGAFLAAAVSCAGGTETDNPATTTLEDFTSSRCKTQPEDPGRQAIVLASDADGLQCVEWAKESDGSLSVRLLNFPEPCGDQYLGSAVTATNGSLELSVFKDSCQLFKCGLCVFDFAYSLTGIETERPLSIHLGSAVCASQPTTFKDEITLPVDEQDSGVVCRYLERSASEWYGRGRDSCGERNLPCGKCDNADITSCASGLTCTEVSDNDSRCLQDCSSDSDCAGGLTSCQDGVCQASFSW